MSFLLMFMGTALIYPHSDFIWDFGKLPFPTYLGKYFIKIGKIKAKIDEIGKIKVIFGLGMTPIYGLKNGQIKSLPQSGAKGYLKFTFGTIVRSFFVVRVKKGILRAVTLSINKVYQAFIDFLAI